MAVQAFFYVVYRQNCRFQTLTPFYTSLFIRKLIASKKNNENSDESITMSITKSKKKLRDIFTIIYEAAPAGGIFNIKLFNAT